MLAGRPPPATYRACKLSRLTDKHRSEIPVDIHPLLHGVGARDSAQQQRLPGDRWLHNYRLGEKWVC